MPHRGEYGTVVGFDADLGMALIEFDELRGLPPEACEASEYTADLNKETEQ